MNPLPVNEWRLIHVYDVTGMMYIYAADFPLLPVWIFRGEYTGTIVFDWNGRTDQHVPESFFIERHKGPQVRHVEGARPPQQCKPKHDAGDKANPSERP